MSQLTHNAQETLLTIAYMLGEPGEFYVHEIVQEEGPGSSERGLKGHTLPALARRGYAEETFPGKYAKWALTAEGFKEAERLTGGKGLL